MIFGGCLWWVTKKRRMEEEVKKRLEELVNVPGVQKYTYDELKDATKNFSKNENIGSGGSGDVYKGTMPDGSLVAIKVLHERDNVLEGQPEFLNEVKTLGGVRNDNVVRFRGFCYYQQGHRTLHRALVYDYMANGSLQDALNGWRGEPRLSWAISFEILLGTARGLRFLHDECNPRIIHRDIKPANILIDDQLQARLADFGLAKNASTFQTHVTTVLMGTLGFFAPDYALTGRLTEKSDVYSFGVVVLVVLSGMSPFAEEATGPPNGDLVNLAIVRRAFSLVDQHKSIASFMDERFGGQYDRQQAEACLAVGLQCVQAEPSRRPTMRRVVQVLGRHRTPAGQSSGESEPTRSNGHAGTSRQ
eukprot:TRINITY_DN2591_c0_g2_i1.p1 TRINITY_DN2591_c0_g2~~TRINITY_DN2591_c0_g2_i1.p1  ORF type:complete len:361 (-),score=63.13 TRINITY_DN2591_c0_g2_i1:723-1805(-)